MVQYVLIVLHEITWKSDGLCPAQCKMLLFCAKTVMKEPHNFELAHLKMKTEEKHWWVSSSVLSRCFFCATIHVVGDENTWRWMVCQYKGLQVYCFWDFERFFVLPNIACPGYHTVYWLYVTQNSALRVHISGGHCTLQRREWSSSLFINVRRPMFA